MNPQIGSVSKKSESVCYYGLVKCEPRRRHVIQILVAQPHFQALQSWLRAFLEFNFSLPEDFEISKQGACCRPATFPYCDFMRRFRFIYMSLCVFVFVLHGRFFRVIVETSRIMVPHLLKNSIQFIRLNDYCYY